MVDALGDAFAPGSVIEVPPDGLGDALLERRGWLPSELAADLGGIDGVATIVSGSVGDERDELAVGDAIVARNEPVEHVADLVRNSQRRPLVLASHVVRFARYAAQRGNVQRLTMVDDVQPVAHVLAVAIDGHGLAFERVQNREGNQLFGKLVRTIVVGAVGGDGRQAVGVKVGAHEVIRAALGGSIG